MARKPSYFAIYIETSGSFFQSFSNGLAISLEAFSRIAEISLVGLSYEKILMCFISKFVQFLLFDSILGS